MACQDRQIYIDLCILGQVAEHWALVTYLPVSGSSEASASARGSDKDRHRPGEGGGLQASQHLVNIHRNDALTTLGGCQHQHLVNTHRNDALTTLGGCQHQHLVNTHRNDALTTLGGGGLSASTSCKYPQK